MGWVVDMGWMPLPTRPQRYCDPASLALFLFPAILISVGNSHLFRTLFLVQRLEEHSTTWSNDFDTIHQIQIIMTFRVFF